MNTNDESLLLDEPLSTPSTMWWITGIILCSGLISIVTTAKGDLSPLLLTVLLGTLAFIVGIAWLVYWLYGRRIRLKMNATRIWSHVPLSPDRSLNWADIRTAAVVTLRNTNYPPMIVLSIHTPEETLTRKRMVWKNPKRGEELRLPLTDARRAVIEQQLGMCLPTIEL